MRRRIGIESCQGNAEERDCYEYDAMIAVLQEVQRVQPESLSESESLNRFRCLEHREKKSESDNDEPCHCADIAGTSGIVRVQQADQTAPAYPPERCHGSNGTEFLLCVGE